MHVTEISKLIIAIGPTDESYESKNAEETKTYDEKFKNAWKHCKDSSKSIEVLYKNEGEDKKVLAKVHFRLDDQVSDIHTYVL